MSLGQNEVDMTMLDEEVQLNTIQITGGLRGGLFFLVVLYTNCRRP